ncbi:MAG: DUF2863 family protein, partial [Betaproteobacteria bacterium]|nr:DUF2863 family protein [Betaproteobacteria bacterium]
MAQHLQIKQTQAQQHKAKQDHRLQNQNAIESALDQTLKINPIAFDSLAENAETLAESLTLEQDGKSWDVVLIAIPIIARTRYSIPSGKLSSESIAATGNLLHDQ